MKRTIVSTVLVVFCGVMITACQTPSGVTGDVMGTMKKRLAGLTGTYQTVDLDSLPPVSRLAIAAFEMEKQGILDTCPFVRVDQGGKRLFNETDYSKFTTRHIAIVDFEQKGDGIYSQTMICESVDPFGRIDVSENRLVYTPREPSEKESAEMKQCILDSLKNLRSKSTQAREELKKAVVAYQRAAGLTADGIPGKNTAESLARDIPILLVSEISSTVLYPQEPAAELYVLPYETVNSNISLFNKGFTSIDVIRKYALTPERLKKQLKTSRRFVLFVYFLDRVNPELPVRISLSPKERTWSTTHLTPQRYAALDVWPVMIETIDIDESIGTQSMYANLYMKLTCIGSFRIY